MNLYISIINNVIVTLIICVTLHTFFTVQRKQDVLASGGRFRVSRMRAVLTHFCAARSRQ